ncbi:MAG: site-specific DNA-methyltransferase [Oscillospiraceae bacterium]|nr:site-specific DNA-methyltransferase [Oscillospiraceae bacterium]
MQSTERFEKVNIDRLVPYVRNARTHSKEQILQLRSSLREFGFVNPVIVDKDYNIIAGHGRIIAAKAEGLTEVPCVFVEHLTEAQKKAYILADNRLAMNAGWDDELLTLEFTDLKDLGFDVELTGFDTKEIEKLFAAGNGDAQEDEFDVDAELDKPMFSKLGDIWTLGRHRVICGDSTKADIYGTLMQGKQANLIVTDPPYGIDYQGTAGKIKNDKFNTDEKFYDFLFAAFKNMESALASDGAAYVFHADSKGLTFRKAFDDAGFKLSGACIWVKNTFTLGRSDYQWCHEPCLYGWKKSGKHIWYGDRKQSTIWNCDKPSRSEKHPTMKPVPLLAIPITNSTQTNGIVLEPFGGSGSTLICCEQLGRICYVIELDEKFVDVIVNRYIETIGNADGVFLERGGATIPYSEVAADG